MNHDTETDRPGRTLPAFFVGLILGVGGTWLLLPRNTAPAVADAAGATVAGIGRNSATPAPPQAVTFIEEGVGTGRSLSTPNLKDAPRPIAAAGSDPSEVSESASSDERLAAIRETLLKTSTASRRDYLDLLQGLTPEDAPRMIELFRELGERGYPTPEYDRLFWQRWAEIDGAAASAAMFARDKRFPETQLSNIAISTWAKSDPEAASAWLFAQEDIPLREGMTKGLIEGMAEHDPADAMRFLLSANLSSDQLAHGYVHVARQYNLQHGLDSVGQWYQQQLAEGRDPGMVANAAVGVYVRAPLDEALGWANTLDGASEITLATRNQLHARLAQGRPSGLIDYLAKEPGAENLAGVGSLSERAVSNWIQTNPGAMANWLKDNRELPNYDLVAAPFAAQVARDDREAALAWAETLRDPALRETVKERIANVGNAGR